MPSRRTFCALAAGALAAPHIAWGQQMKNKTFFYVSLGPALTLYRIDAGEASLAKAELRFQELYGRRRRISKEGQEPAKMPEELEIEQLNRQLKEVLEHHLQRLEPSSSSAGRARWRERLAGVGAPMEARSIRR